MRPCSSEITHWPSDGHVVLGAQVAGKHLPVAVQLKALTRRIQGHFNYFAVSGNFRSLLLVLEQAKRSWYKWLCRRSQRTRLTWERFADLLRDFPLPQPRILVRIWAP